MHSASMQRGIQGARVAIRRRGAVGIRNLHLHEFPSMELLREHGIRTPKGYLASTQEEAMEVYQKHFVTSQNDSLDAVMKAQVLSGGRNAGTFVPNGFKGGVHVVKNAKEALDTSGQMLGQKLVTAQAPDGVICKNVLLVEHWKGIQKELYLSILMDRSSQGPLLIGSPMGGSRGGRSSMVSLARSNPNLIFTEEIDVEDGLEVDQCERMAENLGLDPGTTSFDQTVDAMTKLYRIFEDCDCTQIEVNPLAEIGRESPTMIALDAKIQFDDNAAFRQPQLFAQRDYDQEDPREALAIQHGIDYIGLEGSIGCMVNGAGLAMATMDLIHAKGGSPSNFLDVGGGASEQQVKVAFEILEQDPLVKVILINIFGGLMRCDVIANGILNTIRGIGMQTATTPIVIRLQGTNYSQAKQLIDDSCLPHVFVVDDLDEATTKAVELASGNLGVIESSSLLAKPMETAFVGSGNQRIPKFEGFSI